ncbi:hypothetical protein ES703_30739 [subsurface metagenome]
MASAKQKKAAKRNIKKAQAKWKSMSSSAKARAQPQGRGRAKPGTKGKGNFYRIVVRPKSEFVTFRNHDVGTKGHLQRLAGRRKNGSWATQAWLIAKTDSRVSNGILVGKTSDAKKLLSKLQGTPKKVRGDIFKCRPRKNIPEKTKPTPAMRKAQTKNIKKAQAARRKKRK